MVRLMAKKVHPRARKPHQRREGPHRRYSWALHFSPRDPETVGLSRDAREGLAYASKLARDARERSYMALKIKGPALEPLTPTALAGGGVSPSEVKAKITQARIELFGRDLSDSAIAYRLKKRRERGVRSCAEPDCEKSIPALASARRRYCDQHGSPAARVRRHRHGTAGFAPVRRRRPREKGSPFPAWLARVLALDDQAGFPRGDSGPTER